MIPCYKTHGSRKRIKNQSVHEEYKIWVLVAEACGYIDQLRSYQGKKKEKPATSSTKWGLRKNFVMQLMECLTPAFNFDILWIIISHIFVCLPPTLELTIVEQQVCSAKIGYVIALSLETNSRKKSTLTTLNTAYQVKEQLTLIRTAAGRFTQLLLNLVNLRDLCGVGTKLKESIFENNNQINSTVTTRTLVLSTEWTRMWPNTRLSLKSFGNS